MDDFSIGLRRLKNGESFSSTRLAHGFWEACLAIRRQTGSSRRADREDGTLDWRRVADPAKIDAAIGIDCFLETGFLSELLELFENIPRLGENLLFSASPDAWPHSRRIEGTPIEGLGDVLGLIEDLLPAGSNRGDALSWKSATIRGEIAAFYAAIRHRRVVILGPPRLRHLGELLGLESCHSIEIPLLGARRHRLEIERRLVAELENRSGPTVVLMQAGSLATWLILRLHGRFDQATLLDMGGALNICSISTLLQQHWGKVFRAELARTLTRIHPGWQKREEAFEQPLSPDERRAAWLELSRGIHSRVASVLLTPERGAPPTTLVPTTESQGAVEFIERKEPDFDRVDALLSRSRQDNHWANFGPVSRALERAVAELVDLPASRSVVACSSATAALQALVGAHSYRARRPLRWVVSAFGFYSTRLGPLADAIVLDCDRDGLLDRQALAALDPASWDGVIVTNPFGIHPHWQGFIELCRERGKILLYDNAHALLGCDRRLPGAPDEVVSFHHTKPWGVGEGGCAIVSNELEPIVRALINFGAGLDARAQTFALNGKASDPACALILERLETLPSWSWLYHLQERRVIVLGAKAGLRPLAPLSLPPRSAAALICQHPVPRESVLGKRFGIEKYYRPLAADAVNARWLYERILNVPCHPGMATLASDEIVSVLSEIVDTARRLAVNDPLGQPVDRRPMDGQPIDG